MDPWNPQVAGLTDLADSDERRVFAWIVIAAIAVPAAIGVVFNFDFADQLVNEAIEKEARVLRVLAEPAEEKVVLSLPLDCQAWVAQRGAGERWRVKCVPASAVKTVMR